MRHRARIPRLPRHRASGAPRLAEGGREATGHRAPVRPLRRPAKARAPPAAWPLVRHEPVLDTRQWVQIAPRSPAPRALIHDRGRPGAATRPTLSVFSPRTAPNRPQPGTRAGVPEARVFRNFVGGVGGGNGVKWTTNPKARGSIPLGRTTYQRVAWGESVVRDQPPQFPHGFGISQCRNGPGRVFHPGPRGQRQRPGRLVDPLPADAGYLALAPAGQVRKPHDVDQIVRARDRGARRVTAPGCFGIRATTALGARS